DDRDVAALAPRRRLERGELLAEPLENDVLLTADRAGQRGGRRVARAHRDGHRADLADPGLARSGRPVDDRAELLQVRGDAPRGRHDRVGGGGSAQRAASLADGTLGSRLHFRFYFTE